MLAFSNRVDGLLPAANLLHLTDGCKRTNLGKGQGHAANDSACISSQLLRLFTSMRSAAEAHVPGSAQAPAIPRKLG
jgi:hypothetical protein